MPIKTVFFDMGGTIDTYWYSTEMRLGVTPGLQKLLSSHDIDLHLTDFQLYELVSGGMARYHQWRLASYKELSPYRVWHDYILRDYPDEFPQLASIADELMVWIETHYYQRQMRPEIPAVLEAIQKMGYKIGLISNVTSHGQVPYSLKEYGIQAYFNPIVLSSEYGRRKPDPSIFHYAARLSNTPTSECAYIGDRISRDILGAKRAGFRLAIQIQHDFAHGESDEGAIPDVIVNDMHGLLRLLQADHELQRSKSGDECAEVNKVRAILFDADGVLYYRKDKGRELTSFLVTMGIPVDRVPIEKLQRYRSLASIGQMTFEDYKKAVLHLYGITDPELIARGIEISLDGNHDIGHFEGVRETLEELKNRKLYLGIVTDTAQPLHVKLGKLERGGIGHVWDSIIASQEVGIQKPDPKIYQLALQQLGLQPCQAIFVGHKTAELEGARKVGMKTVAFNYDPDAIADYYIDHFSHLADLSILN
jgi:putative hydrolase of the HAD superfamily